IIFDVQRDIIRDLAKKSSCILVGRCSDAILEGTPNNMNIYIYAPVEKRLDNCVHLLGMEEATAKRAIASVDRARDGYHKTYAGFLPSDPAHKHLMIDSSLLGPEDTAHWIAQLAKKRFS
ncbi:MAG: cytidylate kinase-like family protein, partial [Eubacteriales bacterium]|nr:cytidylate kinase-like family protein [Eubacteriales bacterium]